MFRTLLKSEIHRVTATQCELHYEGACAIHENLPEAAGIVENELTGVWNTGSGERCVTCAIKGQLGSDRLAPFAPGARGPGGDAHVQADVRRRCEPAGWHARFRSDAAGSPLP